MVRDAIHKLPSTVRAEHGEPLERFLVDQAREHAPDFVAITAKHAVAVLDPDGTAPSDDDHQRLRGLRTPPWWIDADRKPRRNQTHHVPRYLTPEAA